MSIKHELRSCRICRYWLIYAPYIDYNSVPLLLLLSAFSNLLVIITHAQSKANKNRERESKRERERRTECDTQLLQ